MDISLDASFEDSETLLVLAVQSFVQSNGAAKSIEALSKHQSTSWSYAVIERFMTFLRNNLEELNNAGDVLKLLNHFLDQWSDTTIYSTMVYEENEEGFSVLTILTDWMLTNHRQYATEPVVSKIWLALERLQNVISWQCHPVDEWWVESTAEWMSLAQRAIRNIADDLTVERVDMEVYCGNLSLLASLLQYDVCDWLTPLAVDDVNRVVETILGHCHVWQQESLNESARSLKRGLLSMRLLSIIARHTVDDQMTQDFDNMANSTSLVENVVQVAFPSKDSTILDPDMELLRPMARSVVQAWNQEDGEAWACVLAFESHWGTFLQQSWRKVQERDVGVDTLQGMLVLHKICPHQAKSSIAESDPFAGPLLSLVRNDDNQQTAAHGAALLRLLLGDLKDKLNRDEVSRIAWEALEQNHGILPSIVMKLENSGTRAMVQPLLVNVLDILDLAIHNSSAVTPFINTKEVETLIDLMNISEANDMELDEDTPQTNNLSRFLDESVLNLEEGLPKKQVRGMDTLVGVAAATVLARFSNCATIDGPLDTRIQRVTQDYVDGFEERTKHICFDLHRRKFRLHVLTASKSDEDEEMIATTQWKRFECHRQEVNSKDDDIAQGQRKIDQLSSRIKTLMAEKSHLQLKIKTEAVSFQKRMNQSKKGAKVKATRLVEHHVNARKKAEAQVGEAMKRVELAKSMEQEAQQVVEACQANERKVNEALQAEQLKVENLESTLQETQTKNKEKEKEIVDLQSDLDRAQDEAGEKELKLNAALTSLEEKESQVEHRSEQFEELEVELDSAYEKLVMLAQVYEAKEEEMEELTRKSEREVRNAKRKLDNEIQRNDDLEEDLSKIQRDNDRIAKKYERAKLIIEQERQARTEEKERRKRFTPVSYINSLHDESQRSKSTSSTSQRSKSTTSTKDKSSTDRRRFTGKENSSFYSSTSRSRSRRNED